MERIIVGPSGLTPEDLTRLESILKGGGIGIVPTDTVYGLAALATDEAAVERLLEIKQRPASKPLPVQASGIGDVSRLAVADGPEALALMREFWPGPLTIVLRRRPGFNLPFQGESVGIRIPDNSVCLALIESAGLLVVPSANLSGESPPARLRDVSPRILARLDFSVDAGTCPGGTESTVVDLTGELKVLREGAISTRDIIRVARSAREGGG